jgi:hypothetical protein
MFGPTQKPIPVTMWVMGTQLISTVCKTKNVTNHPKLYFFILDQKFRKSQKVPRLFVVLQSKFSYAKSMGTCLQVWVWVNSGSIYMDPCKNLYPLSRYGFLLGMGTGTSKSTWGLPCTLLTVIMKMEVTWDSTVMMNMNCRSTK